MGESKEKSEIAREIDKVQVRFLDTAREMIVIFICFDGFLLEWVKWDLLHWEWEGTACICRYFTVSVIICKLVKRH